MDSECDIITAVRHAIAFVVIFRVVVRSFRRVRQNREAQFQAMRSQESQDSGERSQITNLQVYVRGVSTCRQVPWPCFSFQKMEKQLRPRMLIQRQAFGIGVVRPKSIPLCCSFRAGCIPIECRHVLQRRSIAPNCDKQGGQARQAYSQESSTMTVLRLPMNPDTLFEASMTSKRIQRQAAK